MLQRVVLRSTSFGISRMEGSAFWISNHRMMSSYDDLDPSPGREKKVKDVGQLTNASSLFTAKQYERLGKTGHKLLKKKPSKKEMMRINKQEVIKQKKQRQNQILVDKEAKTLSKGALQRKMSAITKWAKREHPEIWERIVSKISLKETLQGTPWEPSVLLSYEEMEEMKELRQENAAKWNFSALGHRYGVSSLSASKIVSSVFSPSPEQRVTRWLEREEFKQIQTQFLRSVAKQERAKLIEQDLKTRYGSLYTPPRKIIDPLYSRLAKDANSMEESDSDSEWDEEEEDEDEDGDHARELSSSVQGGMDSVYRRITAEAKALVAAKKETNSRFFKEFHAEVQRTIQREFKAKEKKEMVEGKEAEKPKRKFFNMFGDEPPPTTYKPKGGAPSSAPWRNSIGSAAKKQHQHTKSENIIHWPKE